MAAELPKYKASVGITPATVVDVQKPFSKISALLDTYSTKRLGETQRIANMQAAEAGEQAGYDINFQPLQGNSEADLVYNKAAKQANRLTVGADISSTVQRIQGDILNSPNFNPQTAEKEFSSSVQGYAEGLLTNIPETSRPYAENMLKYHAVVAGNRIGAHAAQGIKSGLFIEATQHSDQFQMDAYNAARQGDIPAAMTIFSQAKQSLLLGVQGGVVHPGYAASQIKQMEQGIHMQTYQGQFDRAIDSGKTAEFLTKWDKFEHKDISPVQKQTLNNLFHSQLLAKEQIHNLSNLTLQTQAQDNLARVKEGQQPNQQVEQDIISYHPNLYPAYVEQKQQAQNVYSVTQATYGAPPAQQQDILQRNAPDLSKPGAAGKLISQAQMLSAVAQQNKFKEADPAGYTLSPRNPVLPSITATYQTTKDFNRYCGDILSNQYSMGISPDKQRLIPNAQAATIVSQVMNGNKGDGDMGAGVRQLEQLQQQYGKYFPVVLKSLSEQKLPKTYNMLLNMQNTSASAELPAAIEAFNLAQGKTIGGAGKSLDVLFKNVNGDTKTLNSRVNSNMQNWLSTTNGYSSMSGETQAEYVSGVTNLAKYYVAKGLNVKVATDKAYNALIGSKYSYVGDNYRVPYNISPDLVKGALILKDQELNHFDFKELSASNPYISRNYINERTYKDAIAKGHWISKPDDSGWQRVDVNGLPVIDRNGKPFQITNEDLINPAFTNQVTANDLALRLPKAIRGEK